MMEGFRILCQLREFSSVVSHSFVSRMYLVFPLWDNIAERLEKANIHRASSLVSMVRLQAPHQHIAIALDALMEATHFDNIT